MTPKVRAAGLLGYLEVARELGIDPYAMLQANAIDPRTIEDVEWMVSARAVVAVLEASAEQSGRDDIGLLIARNRSYAHIGPLSLLLQHLDSPRDAVRAIAEFRHLLGDTMSIDVEDVGDVAIIRFSPLMDGVGLQMMAMCVAIAYRILSDISGGLWQPEAVHFMSAPPHEAAGFSGFFRAPVEFDSSFDGFSCAARALDVRNVLADSMLARHARGLLRLMEVAPHRENVLDHTKYSIALLLGLGQATLAGVAANLGVSQRTLQRALELEGTSFGRLLNETRRQLALRYLRESARPIGEIAEMVGYANISSFSRWFANEFDEAPLAFRARIDSKRRLLRMRGE